MILPTLKPGYFCYYYKNGIITNGLGIIRHFDFYNKDFPTAHLELIPNKNQNVNPPAQDPNVGAWFTQMSGTKLIK